MDFIILAKLALVCTVALLLSYFVLNAVLAFLSKFSEQLRKMAKNMLIAVGAAYVLGLFIAPVYVLDISKPLIELVSKIAPDFLRA